jgi:hypothetical protein
VLYIAALVHIKVKVPCNRPEGPEWGRGIALHFLDLGTRRGGWSAPCPSRFTPGKDPVPIVQEVGWAPGLVWTCAKNLAPAGVRSPDRPARSQSLHRLSYLGPYAYIYIYQFQENVLAWKLLTVIRLNYCLPFMQGSLGYYGQI